MVLKSQKVLNKRLRTKIKRTNLKKKLKYTLETREFHDAVAKYFY